MLEWDGAVEDGAWAPLPLDTRATRVLEDGLLDRVVLHAPVLAAGANKLQGEAVRV